MGKIKVTHYRVRSQNPDNAPKEPFSAAVLSDLHNAVYHSDVRTLTDAIIREHVAAVFSVGDLVVSKGKQWAYDQALELLGSLTERVPVYAVNGNHEVRMRNRFPEQFHSFDEKARALGTVMVSNIHVPLRISSMRIGLYGLELNNGYFRRNIKDGVPEKEPEAGKKPPKKHVLRDVDITKVLGTPDEDEFTILLAHHPKYFPAYAGWGADLTLSGHIHGGIIRLPGIGGVIGPDPGLFPKYDRGEYEYAGKKMIVSAGLGTHTISLRVNNPPELVILDFV